MDRGEYLLPSIQREFVWKEDQIEKLFDSLMEGFPIGSFLFWEVDSENKTKYVFYNFLKNYHENNNRHNEKANIKGQGNSTIAILDGQQRLTSLYIGLKGTYASKIPYKRWDNKDAYPVKKLFLNILNSGTETENKYEFKFLTNDEAKKTSNNEHWYEVGNILDVKDVSELVDYVDDNITFSECIEIENRQVASRFARNNLIKLFRVICEQEIISYYLEKNQDLDKVLNIFIRVNSGGTILSYSDLLLSIASAQWEIDAREEIHELVDDINIIGNGFNINKDFVLKAALVLTDLPDIAFKVNNFNKANMKKIENNWENIKEAIRWAVYLISDFGFSRDNMKSNNAIIPIAYYFLKKDFPNNYLTSSKTLEDRIRIKKWLTRSLIKRVFSGQPDNVLRPIRRIIKENNDIFPYEKIVDEFKGNIKNINFTKEDIEENIMELKYGDQDLLPVLMLLYPDKDISKTIHIDHIYPKSKMKEKVLRECEFNEDKISFYMSNVDNIANLQLLYQIPNMEKSDTSFKDWFEKNLTSDSLKADYREANLLPDMDYKFEDFEEFIEERRKMIKLKLENILL